jgi:two-component system, NarL family, response regulator DesR
MGETGALPAVDTAAGRPPAMMIRVLLAQDRNLIRGALAALLDREDDIAVVAEAAERAEIAALAVRSRPDVVVLDLDLLGLDYLSTLHSLVAAIPGPGVLVLTDLRQSSLLSSTLPHEPRVGFVTKEAPPSRLPAAIRLMARGEPAVDPELAVHALTSRDNPLTRREREVLGMAAAGAPAKEIAAKLFLSAGTVRNYLSSSIGKTGARTRIEAIRIARDAGWL